MWSGGSSFVLVPVFVLFLLPLETVVLCVWEVLGYLLLLTGFLSFSSKL
jgi:hypothetical protein